MSSTAVEAAFEPATGHRSATAQVEVSVRDGDGQEVLGNTVIVLRHLASGQAWRELRYRRRLRAFIFEGLPEGAIQLRVMAVGYEAAERTFILGPNDVHREDVVLAVKPPVERLEFDVRARRVVLDEVAAGLSGQRPAMADPEGAITAATKSSSRFSAEPLRGISPTSLIAVALADDYDLVDALTLPVAALPVPVGLPDRIRATILQHWDLHGPVSDQHTVLGPLVQTRLRLFLVARAVFRNPYVRTLTPPVPDERVGRHLIGFLDSLDSPDLDGVMPLLVAIHDPELSCVESLLRALLPAFPVRVRPGVARVREAAGAQIPSLELTEAGRPLLVRHLATDDRQIRTAAVMFTIMRLAELVAATRPVISGGVRA